MMSECSPNVKDVIRHRIGPDQYITANTMRLFKTIYEVHLLFEKFFNISRGILLECKPWNIREGKDDTCLCKDDRNFELLIRTTAHNRGKMQLPYLKYIAQIKVIKFIVHHFHRHNDFYRQKRLLQRQELPDGMHCLLSPEVEKWIGVGAVNDRFMARDVVSICIGKSNRQRTKDEIVNMLLCRDALPSIHSIGDNAIRASAVRMW